MMKKQETRQCRKRAYLSPGSTSLRPIQAIWSTLRLKTQTRESLV